MEEFRIFLYEIGGKFRHFYEIEGIYEFCGNRGNYYISIISITCDLKMRMLIALKKLSVYLGRHLESCFGPEQTDQNSIYKITIISLRQLEFVGSRLQIIGPFYNRWKDQRP